MKTRIRYILYFIVIVILSTVVPGLVTNAKYFYNVDIESNIQIANMTFNIKQDEEEPNTYNLTKGETITVKYVLSNEENNIINKMDLKYYLKIVDSNEIEQNLFNITVDDYNYVSYNIDAEENIIDVNGNIVDIDGNIIEERNLTQEENTELQASLQTVNKGFGPIDLSFDGLTIDEKELKININCSEDYSGSNEISFKVKIIAEGISNEDFIAEESANLLINIAEKENNRNSNNITENEKSNEEESKDLNSTDNTEQNEINNSKTMNEENNEEAESSNDVNLVSNNIDTNQINTNNNNINNTEIV